MAQGGGPRLKSNSSIFNDRGDPWVSQKQGLSDYGRTLETENPEFDRYWLAKKAKPHFEKRSERRNPDGSRDPVKVRVVNALRKATQAAKPRMKKKFTDEGK